MAGSDRTIGIAAVGVEGAVRRRRETVWAPRGRGRPVAVRKKLPGARGGSEAPEVVEYVRGGVDGTPKNVQPAVRCGGEAWVGARRRRARGGGGQDDPL